MFQALQHAARTCGLKQRIGSAGGRPRVAVAVAIAIGAVRSLLFEREPDVLLPCKPAGHAGVGLLVTNESPSFD